MTGRNVQNSASLLLKPLNDIFQFPTHKKGYGATLLFVAQGDDGIDAGGTARGDVAGQRCHGRKEECDSCYGEIANPTEAGNGA